MARRQQRQQSGKTSAEAVEGADAGTTGLRPFLGVVAGSSEQPVVSPARWHDDDDDDDHTMMMLVYIGLDVALPHQGGCEARFYGPAVAASATCLNPKVPGLKGHAVLLLVQQQDRVQFDDGDNADNDNDDENSGNTTASTDDFSSARAGMDRAHTEGWPPASPV